VENSGETGRRHQRALESDDDDDDDIYIRKFPGDKNKEIWGGEFTVLFYGKISELDRLMFMSKVF